MPWAAAPSRGPAITTPCTLARVILLFSTLLHVDNKVVCLPTSSAIKSPPHPVTMHATNACVRSLGCLKPILTRCDTSASALGRCRCWPRKVIHRSSGMKRGKLVQSCIPARPTAAPKGASKAMPHSKKQAKAALSTKFTKTTQKTIKFEC